MKVALITRSTLYTIPGGDTVQVTNICKYLNTIGIDTSIHLTDERINYHEYDLFHFFNVIRPADILYHIKKTEKPYVTSPNLVRYNEYDKIYRKGLSGMIFRFLTPDSIEYIKTLLRWVNGSDQLRTFSYIWKGQRKSIQEVLKNACLVLPNSGMENNMLRELYEVTPKYTIIPNGIDSDLFNYDDTVEKDNTLVICVARIEGIKNQINLIKALNKTRYKLLIIGSYAPNQKKYYNFCKKIAASNISFIDRVNQEELIYFYKTAKVHILPSWFETCGLSTLEAAVMGCNVVVTDKGYTREYFEDYAVYCDPASPESIIEAVEKASVQKQDHRLRDKILSNYTWALAASRTAHAYETIQPQCH
jgi:glycosyltransferase involved in cell wall biosynthesis